ncbi:MAG: putative quinol monooxygenase [Woeseiaceae bacterium]|nr:putative quinol monooxygenase [Woeseiaceae bacterium]
MRSEDVTVLIRMQLHTEFIQQGKDDLLALARKVKKVEPDCLAIELAQDLDDLTKITMIEKWSSREAYEGPHMQSSHMQAFIEKSAKFFVGPPDISYCDGTSIIG